MKWLKGILLTLLILVVALTIGLFLWYNYIARHWRSYWTESEIVAEVRKVNETPPPPEIFLQLYDSLYPGHRGSTMLSMFLEQSRSQTKGKVRYKSCSCVKLYVLRDVNMPEGNSYDYGYALSEYTTPEKCFDYLVYNIGILAQAGKFHGLDEVSSHVFNKQIQELNRSETLMLIKMFMGDQKIE
jgi:hypothetical protein